jgi:hypothetical protein
MNSIALEIMPEVLPRVRWTRKHSLTPGKITPGKIGAMLDTAWSQIPEDAHWERVRWARQWWQEKSGRPKTARGAATALHMDENTYSAYERRPSSSKSTGISIERARQFGEKFGVNWVWIASGEGTPFDSARYSRDANEIAAIVDETPEEDRPQVVAAIRTLLRRAGS